MRFYQLRPLFLSVSENESKEMFVNYRKKRDEDINTYIAARNKKSAVKEKKSDTVKFTLDDFSDAEKALFKKLGLSIKEIRAIKSIT